MAFTLRKSTGGSTLRGGDALRQIGPSTITVQLGMASETSFAFDMGAALHDVLGVDFCGGTLHLDVHAPQEHLDVTAPQWSM